MNDPLYTGPKGFANGRPIPPPPVPFQPTRHPQHPQQSTSASIQPNPPGYGLSGGYPTPGNQQPLIPQQGQVPQTQVEAASPPPGPPIDQTPPPPQTPANQFPSPIAVEQPQSASPPASHPGEHTGAGTAGQGHATHPQSSDHPQTSQHAPREQDLSFQAACPQQSAGTHGVPPEKPPVASNTNGQYQPQGTPFNQIVPRQIDWLWNGRLPFGKVVVLQGDPNLGKSLITIDLAAKVSTWDCMPFESECRTPAYVLIMSGEDDSETVIRPRLDAAGADNSKIINISDLGFLLPRDAPKIEAEIRAVEAKLLIIDPGSAFVEPRLNLCAEQDSRQILSALKEVAERTNCCIVWMRHLTKGEGGSSITRGLGSIGISAATRVLLQVGADPQNPEGGVLAVGKNNLAQNAPSLSFQIVPASNNPAVSVVQWSGVSPWNAEDLVTAQGRKSSPKLQRAKEIIREQIPHGQTQWQSMIEEAAKSEDISLSTLNRAKREMGIKSLKDNSQPHMGWYWLFPNEQSV